VTLAVRGVRVDLGGTEVLHGVDLDAATGETVAVLGPSGSGKTTLLRAIAGLESPSHGSITWDGADIGAVPPHTRGFGLMFQDHALFPHRDVGGNVAYGLERQGVGRRERDARVRELLSTVGLVGFEQRSIDTLSGGEQQRVALARALAPRPRMLLFDEPFGALDRLRREQLVADVRAVLDATGVPAVVVTHDHDEAFALAHTVVVLRAGAVVQAAAPAALWRAPADAWVARFVGHGDAFDAIATGGELVTAWGRLPLPVTTVRFEGPVRVVLRADALRVAPDGTGALRGIVRDARFRGGEFALAVEVASATTLVARADEEIAVGSCVALECDARGVLVYPASASDVAAPPAFGAENAQ
jgi:thiamine transport system ATP-binding protein